MKCAACSRDADGKYCRYHSQALEKLREHYGAWVRAYGDMQWSDYLTGVSKMEETGSWVKEVIVAEMKK